MTSNIMNILNVEKVSKNYGTKELLNQATMGVNKGDKIGVIGVNGTGKSTLLKIIAGLEHPDEGNIVKGNNVTISYLAQAVDCNGDDSALSFVMQGKKSASEAQAKTILNKLGFDDYDDTDDNE